MSPSFLSVTFFTIAFWLVSKHVGSTSDVPDVMHKVKRSILPYPPSSVVQITMGITVAGDFERNSATIVFGLQQNAALPNHTQPLTPEVVSARQFSIFDHLEQVFHMYGFNGMECLKKVICQAAENPVVGGLLEEVISFILTPSKHRGIIYSQNNFLPENIKNLLESENLGKNGGNCTQAFPKCQKTPLDLISSFVYY